MCNVAVTEMKKVAFRWQILSSLVSSLWAALDDKRHLSTPQSLTRSMILNQEEQKNTAPTLLNRGCFILAAIYHFYGTYPEVDKHWSMNQGLTLTLPKDPEGGSKPMTVLIDS